MEIKARNLVILTLQCKWKCLEDMMQVCRCLRVGQYLPSKVSCHLWSNNLLKNGTWITLNTLLYTFMFSLITSFMSIKILLWYHFSNLHSMFCWFSIMRHLFTVFPLLGPMMKWISYSKQLCVHQWLSPWGNCLGVGFSGWKDPSNTNSTQGVPIGWHCHLQ
jgi:hypothetical protein